MRSLIIGSLDQAGVVRVETQCSDQIALEGRTFFHQASSSVAGQFARAAPPITFTLTGTATQVYREESASAPVFATCTQSQSITGTRTSD